jgi:DNA-binding SARP family transcriptional activator
MIHCRAFGPLQLLVNGQPPDAELLWRKNLALLVYLARSPRHARTREHLVGLLWADKPEAAARHSLREAIRVVRRAVGDDRLITEQDQVRLAAEAVRFDVDELGRHADAGEWEEAARLVQGEFLEGFAVPDAPEFEDWLAAERLTWRRRGVEVLITLTRTRARRGDAAGAAQVALRAVELEPSSDAAVRAAMEALALAGDRAAALECFERLSDRLRESGIQPEAATRTLAERVRRERAWHFAGDVPTDPESGAESRRAPLIGRERELEAMVRQLERAGRERCATLLIVLADPGLGKTRLLEELAYRARLAGGVVLAARAVEADRATPWSGIMGLARGGLLDVPGVGGAQPGAIGAFTAALPEWADRFGPARGESEPPGPAMSEILRAVTDEAAVLVVLDDAHWLDDDSLGAVAAWLRDLRGCPVAIALAVQRHGPEPVDALRARVGRDVPGETIELRPLDDAAIQRLAAWAVPGYRTGEVERLARRVMSDSAGLPLLALEILHAVALGLDLGTIEGAWPAPYRTLDTSLPGDLPDTVVASIRIGFRRLTRDAQEVLSAAAALDERVPPARLGSATGLTGDRLGAALDELEWQRWLVADARGYSFVARIVRDAIARDMLTPGRRARIGEADRAWAAEHLGNTEARRRS